jgi:putative FmdB family regulatory protein
MPTYYFECLDCKTTETLVLSITEEIKPTSCPECKTEMVRKFGIQTIRFNGGGWGKDAR